MAELKVIANYGTFVCHCGEETYYDGETEEPVECKKCGRTYLITLEIHKESRKKLNDRFNRL